MKRTLIMAKAIVTMDDDYHVYESGHLVVEDERIVLIGSGKAPNQHYDEVMDLPNHLLMPGLINAHTHTPMVLTRGMCEGVSLFTMDGFINTLRRYEMDADADMASASVGVSCAEMIRTGTTCFVDQYFYADRIFEAVDASSLRAVIAYGIVELGEKKARERELALATDFLNQCRTHVRITGWIGPHAFFVDNSEELIQEEMRLALKYKAGFHIHFATSNEENNYCRKTYGCDAIKKMEAMGIMEIPILAAHSITVSNEDIRIMAEHPFYPVMAPSAAMRSGFAAAPVKEMRLAGVKVLLGTDNVCNSNSYDMFREMATAGKLVIHTARDVNAITPKEVVAMATRDAAQAIGQGDRIGSLESGKLADVIALDLSDIGWVPMGAQDWYTQLVYSVSGHSVTHSMVGGKWLMKDRLLCTVDYRKECERLEESNLKLLKRLAKRAGR
ncbi:amidohydrolase family protein [Sphaerochaeta globosa]|uniref:S-adenosylhomocysteine deaminase n=1 Tax=Sphaerochaeta globosa (strain ATCC BAA-1886 / DSM 22777 / Buddy) TaxID=158189 RepID=F0RRI9_SPHGB|nr:amidohydrolase family protein [Sphaerochaeta globosa]ADY14241.1 S-adenosylhomocysteine deaminase [Sphaerochaeta globosa str. Buddy]